MIDLGDTGLLYGRSAAIAERHESLLTLIGMGDRSAVALAQELGVSAATINRDVSYLRSKGHAITARRLAAGWAFAFEPSRDARKSVAGKRP
jgi:DeoR/GlpR family transcriptional regulator of sugar metabolism